MTNGHPWSCFGKLWDSGSVECTGGFDVAYTSTKNNSNYREPCKAYDQCRATKEGRLTPNLVPPSHLTGQRPPAPPPVPSSAQAVPPRVPPVPSTPYTAPQPLQQQWQPPYWQPQAQHYQQAQHTQYVPPYVAQMGPTTVPSPYQAFGAQMPGYLAVPEPIDGTPWLPRLLAELLRAALKALGHAAASFIDHTPLRMYPQPPQPSPQPQQPPTN